MSDVGVSELVEGSVGFRGQWTVPHGGSSPAAAKLGLTITSAPLLASLRARFKLSTSASNTPSFSLRMDTCRENEQPDVNEDF